MLHKICNLHDTFMFRWASWCETAWTATEPLPRSWHSGWQTCQSCCTSSRWTETCRYTASRLRLGSLSQRQLCLLTSLRHFFSFLYSWSMSLSHTFSLSMSLSHTCSSMCFCSFQHVFLICWCLILFSDVILLLYSFVYQFMFWQDF